MKRLLIVLFPVLCVAVFVLSWAFLHGAASGEPPARPAEGPYGRAADMSSMALRVALALGLILVLIVAAVYTLRMVGGRNGAQSRGHVKVLDRCYLAPKRALYMVRMGARVVVVGVTEASITPVLELSAEEGSRLYPESPTGPASEASFSSVLRTAAAKVVRGRG